MRAAVGLAALVIGVFLAVLIQQALPPIHALHGARFVLIPMLFCYAAMTLPFPAMLAGAVYAGLVSDLLYLHVVGGQVEIALGWSIVFFVIFGCLGQGFQPGMRRQHWWPYIPLTIVATSSYLLLQFAMITLRREGIVLDGTVAWRVVGSGLLAGLISPLVHWSVAFVAQFFPSDELPLRGY